MSKSGFDNETIICNYLNGKEISELNNNFKLLIKDLFPNSKFTDKITCILEGGSNKSDILIKVNNLEKRISVKTGSGNSVHQEKITDFIDFLSQNYKITDDLIKYLKLFIWGDGTIDGTGNKSERLTAPQFTKKYPQMISELSKFMDLHKEDLILRFVIYGLKSKKKPDYIYYGNVDKGAWVRSDLATKKLCEEKSNGAIPIGKLTFQSWNRAIKDGTKSEAKRGVVQIKWPTIEEDINLWMKNE